jgi:hypothetical protein
MSTYVQDSGLAVTKTGTGASDGIHVPAQGHYTVQARCGGAFTLDLQEGADDANYENSYFEHEPGTKVTLDDTAQTGLCVPGGLFYKMNITAGGATPVTLTFRRISQISH